MERPGNEWFQSIAKKVPAFGIILGLLSGVFSGLSTVAAKLVGYINPFFLLFVRGVLHVSIFQSVIIYQREPIIPKVGRKDAILLVTSTAFSALIAVFAYTSFKFIPVADSISILFTYPAIVVILSAIFFGEPCRVMQAVVVILSVTGTVLISKPTAIFGSEDSITAAYMDIVYGIVLAVGSSISFALYLLTLQKLANAVPSAVLNFQAGACLVVFSCIGMSSSYSLVLPKCNTDGIIVVLSGISFTVGVYLTVLACKVENARNVSVSQAIEMPVVIVFQVLILHKPPDWSSYVGTILIIASAVLTWGIKWLENKEKDRVMEPSPSSFLLKERFRCYNH